MNFRDGFFPEQGEQIKVWFEALKGRVNPDVILTHRQDDAHQDHRQVSRLVWNTFGTISFLNTRYQNGMATWRRPNLYVPVPASVMQRKVDLLMSHFGSQRSKQWFDPETFLGLARLRGWNAEPGALRGSVRRAQDVAWFMALARAERAATGLRAPFTMVARKNQRGHARPLPSDSASWLKLMTCRVNII